MSGEILYAAFVSVTREVALIERLFFASLELTVLAGLVGLIGWLAPPRSARWVCWLWLLVLAKPVCSLISVFHPCFIRGRSVWRGRDQERLIERIKR